MLIEHPLRATLSQLQKVLSELSNEEYQQPLQVLSNSSIGQHSRHIIEFLQTLISGYQSGVVDYDQRVRDRLLETNSRAAQEAISIIKDGLKLADKELLLMGSYSGETNEKVTVKSTYFRELVYNLEHATHHMAMIKIGILHSTNLVLPKDFGVAAATSQYQKSVLRN